MAQKCGEGTEEAALSGSCEVTLPSADPFSRLDVPLRVEAELQGTTTTAAAAAGTAHAKNLGIVEHKVSQSKRAADKSESNRLHVCFNSQIQCQFR